MTKEEIIDLLTLARVYDARVTVGKAETAAWFLAVNRVPAAAGHQAVVEHYTAPVEPGREVPRITPNHVMAFYASWSRPQPGSYAEAIPAIEAAHASPEHVAKCRAEINDLVQRAAAKFELDGVKPSEGRIPRWRPGMDKRQLALAQVEASRRLAAQSGRGD